MTQLDWLDMLRMAVGASSQTEVAKRLEVSRTTVSLVLSGKYPGKTDRVAERVLKTFGQVQCTHTGQLIQLTVCVSYTTRRAPINNPLELSQWRACRSCPLRPTVNGDEK
ncbi:helix-turn-helix domain-containing protein [Burkholderia gladioli]|uniref:helix-turn-helix domain-containing protein n=1 Tax=Burkholderia gladioli TaxID=28095 RepID=UPI00163F5A20|nr:helix-turn-helix domain-containing protein [Burkholderia gladioli]